MLTERHGHTYLGRALLAAALLASGPFAAGCGGGSGGGQTSTPVARSAPPATAPPTTSAPTVSVPARPRPRPPATTTAPAPQPAPAPPAAAQGSLAKALATVRGLGYTVPDPGTYRPQQTLKVLIGIARGSFDGRAQRAFFFEGDRYLGTDSTQSTASLRVGAQDDTSATLLYALYRPRDPLCCPSGGVSRVRFALDNGRLSPLTPIPPAASSAPLSRR